LLFILLGFGTFVFLDWIIVSLAVPTLAKIFFGIETVFTRSPFAALNSTFFAAMLALTYLSIDPLIKAAYTLRCFYGEARASGADIKAELRQIVQSGMAIVVSAIIVLCGLMGMGWTATAAKGATPEGTAEIARCVAVVRPGLTAIAGREPNLERLGHSHSSLRDENTAAAAAGLDSSDSGRTDGVTASERSGPSSGSSVSPPELDKQIGETLKESKYTWRFPRDTAKKTPEAEQGVIGRFMDRIGNWISSVRDWLLERLRKMFNRRSSGGRSGSGSDWSVIIQFLFYMLIAAVVIGVGVLIYYLVRKRGRKQAPIASIPIQPAPDLADENVGAEQLPEDGWTALGRELLQKGELRLALRAFYLASLVHLSSRNLINLARFKSNRDYQRELERRAHSFPQVLALFGENVSVFDRIWYGMHETTPDLVNQFLAKVEMMKAA
jgi:hypothetical protein